MELKVIAPKNCGNSPKMIFIKELNIMMAKNEFQFFFDHITENIKWSILGHQQLNGKDSVINFMESKKDKLVVVELDLQTIISHGPTGAVNGFVTLNDQKRYAYCSIYIFSNNSKTAKIKEMTTYFNLI